MTTTPGADTLRTVTPNDKTITQYWQMSNCLSGSYLGDSHPRVVVHRVVFAQVSVPNVAFPCVALHEVDVSAVVVLHPLTFALLLLSQKEY